MGKARDREREQAKATKRIQSTLQLPFQPFFEQEKMADIEVHPDFSTGKNQQWVIRDDLRVGWVIQGPDHRDA